MNLKRTLIVAPVVSILILAQSYFWVPTYESQAIGNPARLTKFIEASIGDAKILNPILSADSASNRIAQLVFDGLLKLDEDLQLTANLATDWKISEEAYLIVPPSRIEELANAIRQAVDQHHIPGLKSAEVSIVDAKQAMFTREVSPAEGETVEVKLTVNYPRRIRITLEHVDQALFEKLRAAIPGDFWSASTSSFIDVSPTEHRQAASGLFDEFLQIAEHNPVIEFNLRDDVTFHDGHRFDAGDVKFTYDAIMNPKNLSHMTSDFEPVKSLTTPDATTVRVVYKRLFSPAINAWTIGILPEHLLNDAAISAEMERRGVALEARSTFGMRDSEFNRNPVGTGAFRFEEWQSDELIHLKRFENAWEGAPLYEDFFYRVIPDALTQEIEFLTGAVDSYGPQPHQVERYKNDQRYQSFSTLGFNYTYIGYNNNHPLFQNPKVRRALGMAIDVDEIIQYILYEQSVRITGPYPKNTQWYNDAIAPLPYDPVAATALLEQLGWRMNSDGWLEKDGEIFEFNLISNNGNLVRKAIMTTVQNAWKKIGVKCNTQLFEWAVFLEDFINPSEFDAVVLGWGMSTDPDLFQIWHSSQGGYAQFNFVGYDNPHADDLIVKIRQEYDPDVQKRLAHELHQTVAQDQPYTFLFSSLVTEILDKKIVMQENGVDVPLRTAKSGTLYYHFNRWHKVEHVPQF